MHTFSFHKWLPATFVALLVLLPTSQLAAAPHYWLNSEQSQLNFLTTKNGSVTEIQRFANVGARIRNYNEAELMISLASVDTGIAIRDERLSKYLFEIENHPVATAKILLPPKMIDELVIGSPAVKSLDAELSLHGKTVTLPVEVSVVKLPNESLQVSSLKPLLIRANDFSLLPGIEKLRTLAGLKSISPTVPVTFHLLFEVDTTTR